MLLLMFFNKAVRYMLLLMSSFDLYFRVLIY